MKENKWWLPDGLRGVFGFIDWALFSALGWIYKIFFQISTTEFFSNELITTFFKRIQLIIGVFMIFKLSVSILQYIVNPDKLSDPKNPGNITNLITRIFAVLIMLTMIVPLNLKNASNAFETQINNNGILFGTLYSLQSSILKQNTLGKLVLGKGSTVSVGKNGDEQNKYFADIADNFTSTIGKAFVSKKSECSNSGYDGFNVSNLFKEHINDECKGKNGQYAYTYYPILGSIVAVAFMIIFIRYSINIAVRAIKLAVIRLVAPIPIISYMDPNLEKRGMFSNWVKTLVSTYLDLFLRLMVIYFVVFLVEDIRRNGLYTASTTGFVDGAIVFIVVAIGLFYFANEAVPFLNELLGLKGFGAGLGGFLSGMVGGITAAAGTLAAGGGVAKAFSNMVSGGINTGKEAANGIKSGKGVPPAMSNFGGFANKTLQQRTGDKNRTWGLTGMLDHWSEGKMADKYVPAEEISKQKALIGELGQQKNNVDNQLADKVTQRNLLANRYQNVNSDLIKATSERERLQAQKDKLKFMLGDGSEPDQQYKNTYSQINDELEKAITKEQALRKENAAIKDSLDKVDIEINGTGLKNEKGEIDRGLRGKQYDLEVRIAEEQDNLKDAKETRGFMVAKDEKFPKDKPFKAGTVDTESQKAQQTSQGSWDAGWGINRPDNTSGPPR